VKLVFLLRQEELSEIESVRYLPHTWDDLRNMRFVATNETEAYAIGEYMKNQLEDESKDKKDLSKLLKNRPYYVIFALDKKLLDGHEVFKQFLQEDQNPGVSVITAYDEVPKECQKIVSLQGQQNNTCTTMGIDGGDDEVFSSENLTTEQFHSVMHLLANTSLKQVDKKQTMPKMVTFLEMLKVGRVEQLNPLKRWRENDPVKSLSTPVGVGEDGSVFMLDLHEKRQGPHGLVAGMTGSGKSEFLITYILSMAVNYHPDEVSFVLIDYKGGGLADAFENPRTGVKLPHLAGTITNLDGASIQRSLMSIESELVRRQKVFSEVSKDFDEGSMNIYTYQKLYRAGKVSEPMPHLFIVSDEFAELKQQQPEFMDKLISAARIGRSLGVHLILATQKPSGVVNDQIRSNTKFRVCLRVQDRSDSQDMLKRPEAAELTDTGRFYLQVGYNEYFAMGQSAWCGADYEPQDTVPVQRDDAVEFLDMTGQVVTKNKPKAKKTRSGMTQIGAVVQYLSELATSQNFQSHSLGVEPLPAKIEYTKLAAEYGKPAEGINALIGLVDDPMHQMQLPLSLDMMSFHHMALVGLAGSGKSNFFKTMLYSLVMKYTPEDVNFYILDLSGGILSVFKNMLHCGAYLTKENELDFDRLLALIQDIVEERKRLFKAAEVYSYDDYMNIRKLPLALVILDGWANIHDFTKGQQYSLGISKYMREAANYGVRFLFSVNHLNEFSSKVNQELDYKIALQAKDKFEYNDILSLRNAVVPSVIPGRGLCDMDGRALEYQVAVPYCELVAKEQYECIQEDLHKRATQLQNYNAAKSLPVVDTKQKYVDFCTSFALDRIPLGFSMQTMEPIAMPLQQLHTMSMYFGNSVGVMPVIFNILSAFHREQAEVIILRRTSGTIFDKSGEMKLQALYGDRCSIWDTTVENVPKLFDLLVTEFIPKNRVPYRNGFCELNGIPATDKGRTVKAAKFIRSKTTPLLVLFESFADMVVADKDAVFADVFGMLRGFNVYFVGCFYPEDESISVNRVFRSFSQDDFSLLFGGQFHKQWITSIPSEFRSMEKVNNNYNRFIMKYRNGCHRMVMPCGELISVALDPDEKEII
jgi:S-DNA-T family DNA segregation ATPase FtsK/SpoIIIE